MRSARTASSSNPWTSTRSRRRFDGSWITGCSSIACPAEEAEPVPTPLRLLILEDRADDAELMLRTLASDDFAVEHRRVESERAFLAALAEPWDVVLTDYSLPSYSVEAALAAVRECGLDLPVIVVTGSISEEVAVECMRLGAA